MQLRTILPGVSVLSSVHWERRLFDSLIPLPDGTSYNAYLIQGSAGTALLDSTDPVFSKEFLEALEGVERVDYLVSHHTEQDHSGTLPELLARYPMAKLLCSKKAAELLPAHLPIEADRIQVVADGETVSLGDKNLQFVYTPWVHWPETMCTYLPEDKCLFTCDFLGSHLATSELFVPDPELVLDGAKRYYAEIMMPFRPQVSRNLAKVESLACDYICPSHGPVYNDPSMIIDAYKEWVAPEMKNEVVLPYISMHGSTLLMVKRLTDALTRLGVTVYPFDLSVTDIGKLATTLVDAATVIVGTPTVHVGPHPLVGYATSLASLLRPKLKYAGVLSSYGWSSKAIEQVAAAIANLKPQIIGTVEVKGLPDKATMAEIDALAAAIKKAHDDDPLVRK